jgi:hypothetical protein
MGRSFSRRSFVALSLLSALILSFASVEDQLAAEQSSYCLTPDESAAWLRDTVPFYWAHHRFVGYPPNTDWENSQNLLTWASSYSKSQIDQMADTWGQIGAAFESISPPVDAFAAHTSMTHLFLATEEILVELSTPEPAKAEIDASLSQFRFLIEAADEELESIVSECELDSNLAVTDEVQCVSAMAPYHGEWARWYYGGVMYQMALIGSARDSLDRGEAEAVREVAKSMRQETGQPPAYDIPSAVQELERLTDAAMIAFADLFEAEADYTDGLLSRSEVSRFDQAAQSAAAAMDAEASRLFEPCDRVAERLG